MMLFAPLFVALALAGAGCRPVGELPDSACTPGAIGTTDLAVICEQSTEARRRVSESTKRAVLATYGVAWGDRRLYEVDHLVPLEVGGSNDPSNLWPEPLAEARRKDQLENAAHAAVCGGRLDLGLVQWRFRIDWRTATAP